MIERLKIIVSLAIFAASMIGSVTFYFLRVNRPKSADIYRLEWVKEEDARRKEQRRREEAEMRAGATTPEQKTLVSFYFDHDREKERKKFRLGPPITQYYAWLLATDYFFVTYGLCGSVGLPQQNGVEWEVPCYVGIVGDPKTISVHLRTGIISCPGQHTIYDAVLFLASPMTFAEDRRSTEEADDGDAELER